MKHLVDGDSRREHDREIIKEERQLKQFTPLELERNSGRVEVPFEILLPDDLPASFYYCGEMMSSLSIEYKLTAMMIGLKS